MSLRFASRNIERATSGFDITNLTTFR